MSEGQSLKRTPLYECHLEAGARMVDFAGWEMPVQYTGVIEEHRAVRTSAGLFDVSHMGEVRVRGAGAEAFLQRLTPNDVTKLVPGRAHYSGLLTERATYIDDILVYKLAAEDFMVVVNASNAPRDFEWIASRAQGEAEVIDESEGYALLALQGPRALSMLAPLASVDVAGLKYYGFAQGTVDGAPALISRTGYTGEDGFEISIEAADADKVARALLAEPEVLPIGLGARDSLRLEAGLCLYGHDIDDTLNPAEASLMWSIGKRRKEARDFPAGEKIMAGGFAKKLVGIRPDGRAPAREGTEIADKSGKVIGKVTSGGFGPSLNAPVAMGYVETAFAAAGTPIDLLVRGKPMPATVASMPFVPHNYRRPQK
jgi:aminomethyltransferase